MASANPADDFHPVASSEVASIVARHLLVLDQGEEHRLGENEPARCVEVLGHALMVDDEPIDQRCHAVEGEVENQAGIRKHHALDR